jgi:Tfp pilus assembly protein PilF
MVFPVPPSLSGVLRLTRRACVPVALVAFALGGCSFNLGSLSPELDREAPRAAPGEGSVKEAQTHTARGQALLQAGKTEEALAEFDHAIAFDPHNAQALYGRGMIYQGEKQHQSAIDDFTVANGLMPQRAEPLWARAVSYLAMDKVKEAAADLDEAVEADPQNGQIWTTRGLAYERLGDKTKAADCFARALGLRPRDEAARTGLARVGGKP